MVIRLWVDGKNNNAVIAGLIRNLLIFMGLRFKPAMTQSVFVDVNGKKMTFRSGLNLLNL